MSSQTVDPDSLTCSQIADIRNVLNEPLTDKQVMIPFTTRAFFPGSLQPTSTAGGDDLRKQERVFVRMDGNLLTEMDRIEARDYLQKRTDALLATSSAHLPESTSPPAPASFSTPSAASNDSKHSVSSTSEIPYFEIREEYDETGREVRAEAINVMKELEYLQTMEEDSGTLEVDRPAASSLVHDNGKTDTVAETGGSDQNVRVPDDEYVALSNRLDELAKLEEQAEVTQQLNRTSAKKLQSKGWAKGFLNKSSSRSKNDKEKATRRPVEEEQPTSSNRRVVFREENEIREIPRVGENSASDLRSIPALRKPIESDVFSGVVRERSVDVRLDAGAITNSGKPRKKLSRFAQERQERM